MISRTKNTCFPIFFCPHVDICLEVNLMGEKLILNDILFVHITVSHKNVFLKTTFTSIMLMKEIFQISFDLILRSLPILIYDIKS